MRFFTFFGIAFPFAMTALGAAVVFLFRRGIGERARRLCMGFAAGVMTAASVFSLLLPAVEQSGTPVLTATFGFLLGAGTIDALDGLLRRHGGLDDAGGERRQNALLFAAVTLHNIPEGLAVGLAFVQAFSGGTAAAAATVALGIGLQNLPEGAAIALPLRQSGVSRARSFLLGVLSGVVEPIAAACVLMIASMIAPATPWLMAFAAGAMTIVVFGELAPETAGERDGTIAAVLGFAAMMAMDVGLG